MLHPFDADVPLVLEDFCFSRGLTPFSTCNSPTGSHQLDHIDFYTDNPKAASMFRWHCLRVDKESYDKLSSSELWPIHCHSVRL